MAAQQSIIVDAPASKSLSHRVVIAAGLAPGESKLTNVLESQDLERTIDIMCLAGAQIEREGRGAYVVSGMPAGPVGGETAPLGVDVGESGTTCRLLTAVLAAGKGLFEIRGRGRMHSRPIGQLTAALERQGAGVEFLELPGCPPFRLRATGLAGGDAAIGLDESSQYLSGLLLAAPLARAPMTIAIAGEKVVSWPYIELTLQTLEEFGLDFRVERRVEGDWVAMPWREPSEVAPGAVRFVVQPGQYRAGDYAVEGDWSNASYFLAAGALGPGTVGLRRLSKKSRQGDRAVLAILERMGASVHWGAGMVTVTPAALRGVDVDMGDSPDIVPTIATLAALATGTTVIRNVAHLRIKESDRLEAVATNLRRIGATVDVLDDGLRIEPVADPGSLRGQSFDLTSFGDHRIAMSLSLLQRVGVTVNLDDPDCVAKSFPGFWDNWRVLCRDV